MGSVVVPYSQVQQAFKDNPDAVQNAVYQSATAASAGDSTQQARLVAQWNEAVAALEQSSQGPSVLATPQNALGARLQTMLASNATAAGKTQVVQPQQTVTTSGGQSQAEETVEVMFDNNDLIGWLGTGLRILFNTDTHPWISPPETPEVIPDDARIAVFGDWGTGMYGAPVIRDTIVNKLTRCDVVLHLGDTYYSGADDEIARRLIGDWPLRGGNTINRALNGNHEMYSGGVAYFRALASFFKQPASCFAMQNANWVLVGLDTAYKDFDMSPEQVAWLKRIVTAAGSQRKLILFSHHQPFSQLDDQGPNLQVALADLLEQQRVTAWFWGHEHRLVVYEPHLRWGVKGRCVGHGGFPSFRDTDIGAGGDIYKWIHMPADLHAPEALLLDGPNFWVTLNPNQYSPNGFLFLEFDGANAWETYRTPDNVAVSERWAL
jgi:hypothetical protein